MNSLKHHSPFIKDIATVLLHKTENTDASFFKAELAYFVCKAASLMGVTLQTKDKGFIPVNAYAIALATSGFGKGHSINILENEVFHAFHTVYMQEVFPNVVESHLVQLATEKFQQQTGDKSLGDFLKATTREFEECGQYTVTFDSATPAAVKQLRHKLLMGKCGSINFQQDEMGSYLHSSTELLTLFLELFDQGMVKPKLVKNTRDNTRTKEIKGKTPTNMLLFGTPHKLFDGGATESAFYDLLEIGYARRCFFGWGEAQTNQIYEQTAQEVYANHTSKQDADILTHWSNELVSLAHSRNHGLVVDVNDAIGIEITDYRLQCNRQAAQLPEHRELERAELCHRYFKALKLAGALAFISKTPYLTLETWNHAKLLTEESGQAFGRMLYREKNYVRLAKYLKTCPEPVTHVDLMEVLPFYKGSLAGRQEMLSLASSWGYKNHVLISRSHVDNVELITASTLEPTNTESLTASWSEHLAHEYGSVTFPFDKIAKLTRTQGLHWCNHSFVDGHRKEANVIPGFNMIVLDIDGTATMDEVKLYLAKWDFYLHTTKSHTDDAHRFRVVIPISHNLKLSREDYKLFIQTILDSLPFSSDVNTNQRSRKWEAFSGSLEFTNATGKLFDALPYIPNTAKHEEYKRIKKTIADTGALEQWFIYHCNEIGRNNSLYRYGKALLDKGETNKDVVKKVILLNQRFATPLPKEELERTILISLFTPKEETIHE